MRDPDPFRLVCPFCRSPLDRSDENRLHCATDERTFHRVDGIWRMLDPALRDELDGFRTQYEAVRAREGWGSPESDYYRALPFEDRSGRHREIWRIRAVSFRALLERVVEPAAREPRRALAILDLGAGNGWLSYRLKRRGHRVAAVDVVTGREDGLGAVVHYEPEHRFLAVEASFDRLPFGDAAADLVIYNGALHYSPSVEETVREGQRVLRPGGSMVILDSPVYHSARSGEAMLAERGRRFRREHGIETPPERAGGYLTWTQVKGLAARLGLECTAIRPFRGLRWWLQPARARLEGRREPARFPLFLLRGEEES